MLGIGEKFPTFSLAASIGIADDFAVVTITDKHFAGKWKVYFFWPKDFNPVSLVELISFGMLDPEFREMHTQGLGVSVESELAHQAWRRHDVSLRGFPFPMLADTKRELCGELGILDETEGTAQRATFIVDRQDVIRFVYVTDRGITRDPGEVLRVLADLQGTPQA